MGQACAKGDNREDTDNMQPRVNLNPGSHNNSQITSASAETGHGVVTSTSSFQSSFDDKVAGEIFYDGRSTSANEKLTIEDF